ncbi:hypothetical protein AUEXF2481DRAFT_258487 [Aureobasidium subglaciale EXF-2481]|uniref:Zn(2)-C6 fungal-type domain-containing protein n=1 Tax=Aureobasidium subglaciale (strain EXF-2481) TaxID=1043005 RepID=A0A074YAH7_AURSE|nr:uncharacterized protein AUEXF2481DRAFT_258487 [Aureobasidium subglaciale EXF-2481]KEQ94798.1 hypothetical protein AUEXF2481DRAFT_258487 [Aureobasidium subglaciale EXF-2481]
MPPKRIRISEGSCWRCKDRRVLCDVKKPVCTRCEAAGTKCEYGTRYKWANGVAARGRFAGQNWLPVKTPSPPPPRLKSPSTPDDWQVLYFAKEVLPRFSLMDDGPEVDPAWLITDSSIHQAVIAVANAHRLFRNHGVQEETLSQIKQARLTAIRSLRTRLQDSFNLSHAITFPSSVLLCMLDGIIEPQEDGLAAAFHLRGGRAILQYGNHMMEVSSVKSGPMSLFLSVYATMDLTYAILGGETPHLGPDIWLQLADSEAWWSGIKDDHAFVDIMALLAQLAQLGHDVRSTGFPAPIRELLEIQLTLGRTESRLESLATPASSPNGCQSLDALTVFCSAYRASARIYMYRALCNLNISDLLVQESVQEGIYALQQAPLIGKLAHCLLFPCLMIGTHCITPDAQQTVLSSLEIAGDYLSFGSIKIMEGFLRDLWLAGDISTDFWTTMQPVSGKAFMF